MCQFRGEERRTGEHSPATCTLAFDLYGCDCAGCRRDASASRRLSNASDLDESDLDECDVIAPYGVTCYDLTKHPTSSAGLLPIPLKCRCTEAIASRAVWTYASAARCDRSGDAWVVASEAELRAFLDDEEDCVDFALVADVALANGTLTVRSRTSVSLKGGHDDPADLLALRSFSFSRLPGVSLFRPVALVRSLVRPGSDGSWLFERRVVTRAARRRGRG